MLKIAVDSEFEAIISTLSKPQFDKFCDENPGLKVILQLKHLST